MTRSPSVIFSLLFSFIALISLGAEGLTEIKLSDGSQIKGRVMSASASEVTVMSDFGVLRIALDKLTAESRAQVTQSTKPDTEALHRRIAELEAKVSQLQQENEALRKQPSSAYQPSRIQSLTPTNTQTSPASGVSYTISSTGKRHNSHCRYFGTGRSCGPTEGIACKICGG